MENEAEEIDGQQIVWNSALRSIDEVMTDFTTPVFVRVIEGFMENEDEFLDEGDVLKITGTEVRLQKIVAKNEEGQPLDISLDCRDKVAIVPKSDMVYKTVKDLCKADALPGYIENRREFTIYGKRFAPGTSFKVMACNENGISVICDVPSKVRLMLIKSVRGDFMETTNPADKDKAYSLQDLRDRDLPIYVKFLPSSIDSERDEVLFSGTVCLEVLRTKEIVIATNYVDGEKFPTRFSRHIDIKLQTCTIVDKREKSGRESVYVPMSIIIHQSDLDKMESQNGGENEYELESPLEKPPLIDKHIYEEPKFEEFTTLKSRATRTAQNKYVLQPNAVNLNNNNNNSGSHTHIYDLPSPLTIKNPMHRIIQEDVRGISDILNRLKLGHFVNKFIENQIDGQLLGRINESDLVSDLNMTGFEARKLHLYINGWEPDNEAEALITTHQFSGEEESHGRSESPDKWTSREVGERMRTIKLDSFVDFCANNQVNGLLLKSILQKEILESIRQNHNVKINSIEEKRLTSYVMDGWRPKT